MADRPPFFSNQFHVFAVSFMRALGLALLISASSLAAEEQALPMPPASSAPRVSVGHHPGVELAAFVTTVISSDDPQTDTPAWRSAYGDLSRLERSAPLRIARELVSAGLSVRSLYRFITLHASPPAFQSRERPWSDGLTKAEIATFQSNRSDFKKLEDGLERLYEAGTLAAIQGRYGNAREAAIRAYRQADPPDYPFSMLLALCGESSTGARVYLVPSLLAQRPMRMSLSFGDHNPPVHVSVIPIGADGVPEPREAATTRFREVAHWMVDPALERFGREFEEVSRILPEPRRAIIDALYQYDLERRDPLATGANRPTSGYDQLVERFRKGLERWDSRRARYSTLDAYLPELLEFAAGHDPGTNTLPSLRDPNFESWDGVVPREWRIEVVEPATVSPVPSKVARVRGYKRDSSALMLAGDQETNQWLGVKSQPMQILPGDRVSVRVRMRARNVTPRGSRVRAAHLEVRVVNRDGTILRRIQTRELVGTTRWELEELQFVAPSIADSMQVACVLAMNGELYFDDIELRIERPSLWRFLRNSGFESRGPEAPTDWSVTVQNIQTQTGPSVPSIWTLDTEHAFAGKHALKLSGDDQTSEWLEIRSPVLKVTPGQKVRVSARIMSRNITPGPRQHRHANIVVIFVNETGRDVMSVESPLMEGSNDWRPVELEATVPIEAFGVRVGCFLSVSGELWFDEVHLSRR